MSADDAAQPAPVADAPAWLLGRLAWRGWGLPVLAFSVLAGTAVQEPTENTRVAILKALNGNARLPYFGVLCQGFPRLTLVSEEMLVQALLELVVQVLLPRFTLRSEDTG